jgi:hypothetical protein
MRSITGLTGGNVGTLPDPDHKAGGAYHCGVQDIINLGRYPDGDYSTRLYRDRVGGNACSAEDVGDNWPNGGRAAWLRFNNWLVQAMIVKDQDLVAVRAVNFSPDCTACRRYDSQYPQAGIIASTDSVYMHTHIEWYRNTAGTAARAASMRKIELIAKAAIANNKGMINVALSDFEMDDLYRRVKNAELMMWYGFRGGEVESAEALFSGTGKGTPTTTPVPLKLVEMVKAIHTVVSGEGLPAITQEQINAGIKAAMQDAEVLAGLAKAINDDAAQRMQA